MSPLYILLEVGTYLNESTNEENLIIFLIPYFTKPFLIFVIGAATIQHKSRKQVKVSTLLFGYSRRLRHQEKNSER